MSQRALLTRAFPLEDISIRDDGRTVVAYAAMFADPYEVYDDEGHYFEQINRAAFNRTISRFERGEGQFACLFNHGMTVFQTPSERFSMPLGSVVAVRAEQRGLLTETRYNATPLADEVLELIRSGSVRGMSFRGPILRSHRAGTLERLPLIERDELGLRDYGPVTFPMNPAALVVAVRSLAELTNSEANDRLRRAIQDRFVPEGSDSYAWVDDFALDESWLVYCLDGHYYRLGFSVDDEGNVSLDPGDPVEVEREVAYAEISPSASTESTPSGDSTTPPASSERSTPPDIDLLALEQRQRRRRAGLL